MYNIAITGTQTLLGTMVSISVTETDEQGLTNRLFGARTASNDSYDGLEAGSLEEFLEQTITCAVNSLSTGSPML